MQPCKGAGFVPRILAYSPGKEAARGERKAQTPAGDMKSSQWLSKDLAAGPSPDYEYLDSGEEGRLERFGAYLFDRPSPVALWRRKHPTLWKNAAGIYHRSRTGGGHWEFRRNLPSQWLMRWDDLALHVKPTGFGHMGLFPEHTCHWPWVRERIREADGGRVLHLFAYTGAMTLVAAQAGAEVWHVDAVRDVNEWARRNAEASGLKEAPIRWITDDATRFVAREGRRGRRYHGIVLDPPSYGKGPEGEKWIIEDHLLPLLERLMELTANDARFVLFTCHSLGFSPALMRNFLAPWVERFGGTLESGAMLLNRPDSFIVLPAGFYARWWR